MKMNKKLITVIAVIVIVIVCIIAFTGKDETVTAPSEGQPITVNLEPETTREPFIKPSYDKTITVTLPIDVVDKEYAGDLDAYAKAKGYFSVQKKGEDKVKIKMREYSYKLLLTTAGMETVSGIGNAMDSGDYPFIRKLAKYNSDFSEVIFTADKEKYSEADNEDEFFSIVAFYCLYYQEFCEDNKGKCKIIVCESGTNELIEERELAAGDIG